MLIVLAILFLFPPIFCFPVETGLDPSWQLALHLLYDQGAVFGRDAVFTYGPLGFLSARICLPGTKIPFVLVDLFLAANIAILFAMVVRARFSIAGHLILCAVSLVVSWRYYLLDLALSFYLFGLLHIVRDMKRASKLSLFIAAVSASTAFYIKANFGLAAVLVQLTYGFYLACIGRWRDAAFHAVVLGVVLAFWAVILHVDLSHFLEYSMIIASGYNDSMFLTIPERQHFLIWGLFISVSVAIYAVWALVTACPDWGEKLQVLFMTGTVFLLFKQGYIRADGHEATFFAFIPVVLAIHWFAVSTEARRNLGRIITIAAVFAFGYHYSHGNRPEPITEGLQSVVRYVSGLVTPHHETPRVASLPESVLPELRRGTVDVVPTEISLVYHNQLTYNPRPVFQSYSAYEPSLDRLNAAKYTSPNAPEHILFEIGCVDGRYCFFDETQTKLAMLSWYDVSAVTPLYAVLQRRSTPRDLSPLGDVHRQVVPLGTPFQPPQTGPSDISIARFAVKYTLAGRLLAALYHPAELRATIKLSDGEQGDFRVVRGIINGGVILNPYVETTAEAIRFFRGEREQLRRISEITFYSRQSWVYQPNVEVSFSTIESD